MVQVDLITGFLGSGKTTFMRHYARYMVQQGWNVCILENDFGAVNVDVMLLQDILGDHCDMESISGGCDCDTHQRRMRTKLISLAMQGFDRVIIEPSGIFDVDEFFDILHDEPLDKWYRMGNVIAIVDAKQEQQLSPQSAYLLASETANAGMVVLSRSQLATPAEMDSTVNYLNHALEQNGCARRFGADVLRKNWEDLTPQDLAAVAACGRIMRIKGFTSDGNGWLELNASRDAMTLKPIAKAQEVIIVIGEQLNRAAIEAHWKEV